MLGNAKINANGGLMIAFVRGMLFQAEEENLIVIDTGSVGYEVYVPKSLIPALPGIGEEVFLYTYHHIKEEENSLFGFLTKKDLELFKDLTKVSGIGPKTALSFLATMTADEVRQSIAAGDVKGISAIPGIGKKTAERVLVELKERYEKELALTCLPKGKESANDFNDTKLQALGALKNWGFSDKEARAALEKISGKAEDLESILREALSLLRR